MTTTRTASEMVADKGTCEVCGQLARLINFKRDNFGPGKHGGYLAKHGRPGVNPRFACRGSFEGWAERGTTTGVAR
jgi:hypothetical protein